MESNYEYFSHMPYKLWLNLRKNSKALLFFLSALQSYPPLICSQLSVHQSTTGTFLGPEAEFDLL